jgi:hypothetical protein
VSCETKDFREVVQVKVFWFVAPCSLIGVHQHFSNMLPPSSSRKGVCCENGIVDRQIARKATEGTNGVGEEKI